MNTDSPEVLDAKREGFAWRKAQRQPMLPLRRALEDFGFTMEVARSWGKRVLAAARDMGVSEEVIQLMRERMLEWLKMVKIHHRDRNEVLADADMPENIRDSVLADMRKQLDDLYALLYERTAPPQPLSPAGDENASEES